MSFLRQTKPLAASILLLVLAVMFYVTPTAENIPASRPLKELSTTAGAWKTVGETQPEKEILDLLKADDTLTRIYTKPDGASAGLFVAFFKSQRAGVSPHSPKVCLPGSGWEPERSENVTMAVPGATAPITINRYIVRRGENRSLVLYWYQTAHRVIADEFVAKVYLVVDGIRYRRSDASLVRVIVPIGPLGEDAAFQYAYDFVKASFPLIKAQLPS